MNDKLAHFRTRLVWARKNRANAQEELDTVMKECPQVQDAMDVLREAKAEEKIIEEDLRNAIRDICLAEGADAVKAHKGLGVRVKNEFKFDYGAADAWARDEMPALMILDSDAFRSSWEGGLIQRVCPDAEKRFSVEEIKAIVPTISKTLED